MDGLKSRLRESIQLRLSVWLLVAILGVALLAGVFSFAAAFDEAHELQDDILRQIATLAARHRLQPAGMGEARPPAGGDEESRVIVQYLVASASSHSATVPSGHGEALALPETLPDGLQTVMVGAEPYRVGDLAIR